MGERGGRRADRAECCIRRFILQGCNCTRGQRYVSDHVPVGRTVARDRALDRHTPARQEPRGGHPYTPCPNRPTKITLRRKSAPPSSSSVRPTSARVQPGKPGGRGGRSGHTLVWTKATEVWPNNDMLMCALHRGGLGNGTQGDQQAHAQRSTHSLLRRSVELTMWCSARDHQSVAASRIDQFGGIIGHDQNYLCRHARQGVHGLLSCVSSAELAARLE
jgi:hypothetical protein